MRQVPTNNNVLPFRGPTYFPAVRLGLGNSCPLSFKGIIFPKSQFGTQKRRGWKNRSGYTPHSPLLPLKETSCELLWEHRMATVKKAYFRLGHSPRLRVEEKQAILTHIIWWSSVDQVLYPTKGRDGFHVTLRKSVKNSVQLRAISCKSSKVRIVTDKYKANKLYLKVIL